MRSKMEKLGCVSFFSGVSYDSGYINSYDIQLHMAIFPRAIIDTLKVIAEGNSPHGTATG